MSRARREGGVARAMSSLLALVLLGALVALAWLVLVYPEYRGPGRGREVALELRADQPLDELASQLERSQVLEDPWTFAVYARLLGAAGRLREGTVLVRDDMSPRTVLLRVALGLGDAQMQVTVPEGLDQFQIASRLHRWGIVDQDAFIAAVRDPDLLAELSIEAPSAEGYLFPDTYRLAERSDPRDVVRRMVENFRARTESLWSEPGLASVADLDFDRHQVLILASIVEEEAAVAEERPVIAGVFLNRLRSETFRPRHRLQADPTVSYGCRAMPLAAPSCSGFGGTITRSMLEDPANPYNTYRHGELPPGPISNPGLDAIRAVLGAEHHDYLYFVARGGRRHTFSADLDAHNEAVDVYRER